MKVITINREYGAGGHSIGTEVAKALGIEFYDKDIILNVAKESGIDSELVKADNEEISRVDSFIRAITPMGYDQKETIYEAQSKVIIELAKKGPCVILGRCANDVLKKAGIETFDVFIYSDDDSKIKRACELLETDNENDARKVMHSIDHNRRAYYHYFTEGNFNDCRNYNLCIDSGSVGYDKAVEIIVEAVK
ncbi:MAG: cytidylate kinase-like family protein [Lachnospiraceae bacterium]|nr:cytidylate kinase-like family protein [Lachnospiraceae bacterium]